MSAERRLFSYSKPARRFLQLAAGAAVVAAVLLLAEAVLLSRVIAGVFLEGEDLHDVTWFIVAMAVVAVVRAVCLGLSDILAQRSAGKLKLAVRGELIHHLGALGPSFSHQGRSGDLVSTTVQGVEDLDEYVTSYLPQRHLAAVVPVLVAIVVLIIDPLSVLVLLVTGPLLVLFLVLIGGRAKSQADRRLRDLGMLSSSFLDLLQGLPTLKMFGRSKEQVANIQAVSRQYGATTMSVLRTAFETAFVLELSATIATALVAVEVGLRLVHGSIGFEAALAVLIVTPEFFLPIRQLSLRYHAGSTGQAAAKAIFELLDTRPPFRIEATPARRVVEADGPGIHFDRVCYAYGDGRPALLDASFVLPIGARTALIGATGAGKTTVANLLLRFIEPQSGALDVEGVALSAIEEVAWRARVAWVPQRPYLFFGTVADNIRLAKPDATWQEIAEAAHAAGAQSFIQGLPQGYDTLLGDEGAGLSGGQQQRLAIARAFLKDAPYLILDEPTSHLDAMTEASISGALESLASGRTVLMITHRLRLAENADQVLVLDHGRIVDGGSPREILPRYRDFGRRESHSVRTR